MRSFNVHLPWLHLAFRSVPRIYVGEHAFAFGPRKDPWVAVWSCPNHGKHFFGRLPWSK